MAIAGLSVFALSTLARDAGAAPAPILDQSVVATFPGDRVTLTGSGLGAPPSTRAALFDWGDQSVAVAPASPLVHTWQDDRIELSLPDGVTSGTLRVLVDGATSAPVDLLVFEYGSVDVPRSAGTNDRPYLVAAARGGDVWLSQEFHQELKDVTGDGAYQAFEIPQAEGPGIFALTLGGTDRRSRISWLGAGIAEDAAGDVWFTEGGADYYQGIRKNTSRIVRFHPSSSAFDCYTVPVDNAQVAGILVDERRDMIWYTETGPTAAVTGFRPSTLTSDCFFDPYGNSERDPLCDNETSGCHWRFPLPSGGYPAALAMDEEGNI